MHICEAHASSLLGACASIGTEWNSVCAVEAPADGCCLLAQTNNPRKLQVLEELGVNVMGRIPCIVESQEHNVGYLATKQVSTQHDVVSSMT